MIASTCLAVLLVPSLFVIVQHFEEWLKSSMKIPGPDHPISIDANSRHSSVRLESTCTEVRWSEIDRNLLWRRSFLYPFAFQGAPPSLAGLLG
jgi:hypothetical protein